IMKPNLIDEILEAVWIAQEEGHSEVSRLEVAEDHDVEDFDLPSCLKELEAAGLLVLNNGLVDFTDEGRARARSLIRRHRLAQRLLMDVLDVSEKESEELACRFEHFLSEEVTDKVDAFLGYPRIDPNGKPIPAGEGPMEAGEYITPLIMRLSRVEVGKAARVAFLTPSFHKRFDRLVAFGINPGAVVNLHQRKPAYVVRLGETELALDPEIADEIYVRPLN
ncbi:MAG: metal-dependent transcriptional regulator, partial [Fidelibacterota bacterium]